MSQIGIPYRNGGTTPKTGFDCSGFIVWVFKQHNIDVPRKAVEQARAGKAIKSNSLAPGDIVAFKIKRGYHTGIYIGEGKFVHSPRTGASIRTDSLKADYWRKHYVGACRLA